MPLPFLTARWSNLCLLTYAVPAELLRPRLPPGLELDTHPEWPDAPAFVSLVAFDFLDTRVLGVSWPGFRDFAEINLRFYVRRRGADGTAGHRGADSAEPGERGVVFVREFVPQRLVAWVARTIYNEPYQAAPLVSSLRDEPGRLTVEHRLTRAGREHRLTLVGRKPATRPADASLEHFFKEHRWGFGTDRRGRSLRYEVDHPPWDVYAVESYAVDLDWAAVYGPEWAILREARPCSVILAAGSAVRVFPKGTLLPPAPPPTPSASRPSSTVPR